MGAAGSRSRCSRWILFIAPSRYRCLRLSPAQSPLVEGLAVRAP
jgi:hypothetical protein